MSREFPSPITVKDLSNLKEYLKDGLQGIVLCNHGIARSWKYAEYATQHLNTPSVFLEGGLSGIEKLSGFKRGSVIARINDIPERYAVLSAQEVAQYADLLNRLHVCLVDGSKY